MEWILIVLESHHSPDSQWPPLSAGHLAPNPGLWLELKPWLGPDGRDSRDSRARAHKARLGRAQPRLDTGTALVGQTRTAKEGL